MISILVAAAENNAIGKNNQLLWHLPNDMKFFKNTTWGMAVIMGRKTFESLGRPLPGRMNIVITAQPNWNRDIVSAANSLEHALGLATAANFKEVFIIGGGAIYKQSMDLADCIYLTRVHASFEADTFFPVIDELKWNLLTNENFSKDGKHLYDYSFQKWVRK